jgi:hypothetical protein
MTVEELAEYIKARKNGRVPYAYGDEFIISHHTRAVLNQHIHITREHILECCSKASNYDEYIELRRPLAKVDTEEFLLERNKPIPKGRTRRRFR